jgi:cysteine desulfurase/selenocysteine lyase
MDRDSERYWRLVKDHFSFEPGLIYMNNGTLGGLPRSVVGAVVQAILLQESNPSLHHVWGIGEVREKVAALLNVPVDDVALCRNTTEGMNILASGLQLQPGDEVLTTNHEHPGGLGCWQYLAAEKGIALKQLVIPTPPQSKTQLLDIFDRAVTKKTRVISVSMVTFTTGLLFPLKDLCRFAHDRGVLVIIDGAQAPGMLCVDLSDIDCDGFASSAHKWLLAPKTNGILYVNERIQERMRPLGTDRASGYGERSIDKLVSFGTLDIPNKIGLGAAIDFYNAIGPDRVEARCRHLMTSLREKVEGIPGVRIWTPSDPELSAPGLIALSVDGVHNSDLHRILRERYHIETRVVSDTSGRLLNAVRVSTHIYNLPAEIETFAGAIEGIATKKEG